MLHFKHRGFGAWSTEATLPLVSYPVQHARTPNARGHGHHKT